MDETSKAEFQALIKETMQEQQQALLQSAALNAENVVTEKIKENNTQIKEAIDTEVAGSSKQHGYTFKNNINKSNADFCRQVQDIWKRTERALDEQNVNKAKELVVQGKDLIKKEV